MARTEAGRKNRITRLRALIDGQPESELQTQFASAVAELAVLEAATPPDPEPRKASESPNRKRTGGRNRGK